MVRLLVVAWLVVVASTAAFAETVALLPLDGEKRLAIYGQPVASEIGRALEAAGVAVVVVGAKMAVPDRAQLIVDGTIKAGKGDAITLTIRVRDPRDGTVLETLPASAATLTTIDKAAAELSARIVPAVHTHLRALAAATTPPVTTEPPPTAPAVHPARPAAPPLPLVLAAVASPRPARPALELLAHATATELGRWARSHRRSAKSVEPGQLGRASAVRAVVDGKADVGLALEILAFDVEPGTVPLARARVRVRIVDGATIRFERVVRTDTIVGDRGITEDALAGRVAREVLAIVNAQLRRQIAGWR